MMKQLKYTAQFFTVNILVTLSFALIVFLGCLITGVPSGNINLFATYYNMFPLMYLIIIFILSFALCTSNLNLALSYGCRRRDFFWGIHLQILIYVLFGWILTRCILLLPALGNWNNHALRTLPFFDVSFPLYALLVMAVLLLGCTLGPLYIRSKWIGAALMAVIILCGISITAALLYFSDNLSNFQTSITCVFTAALIILCMICEYFLYRCIHKATVR